MQNDHLLIDQIIHRTSALWGTTVVCYPNLHFWGTQKANSLLSEYTTALCYLARRRTETVLEDFCDSALPVRQVSLTVENPQDDIPQAWEGDASPRQPGVNVINICKNRFTSILAVFCKIVKHGSQDSKSYENTAKLTVKRAHECL